MLQNTGASGNVTTGVGVRLRTPTTTSPIVTNTGLQINNQGAANITDAYGLQITEVSGASDANASLVIGTVPSTGSYSFYNAGSNSSYFAGNVGIGTTDPATFKLQITGSIGPTTDDTYDLGDNTHRWQDIYLGPATFHIGTSTSY